MSEFFAFTVLGLVIGAAYAIAASGLVVTYATSNVFNIAHGSVGMIMAFSYWELHFNRGMPTLPALILVVLVLAPLTGLLIERTMMRRLTEAPVAVSLVTTVALLVALVGIAQAIWPPSARPFDEFFAGRGVTLGSVIVSTHQMITFVMALVVAGGLYLLLNRTRTGVAMRAVVDNRELLALHGARPNLLGSLSWALGCSLAALAGILLAPQVTLDYTSLTLLVVSAYAAAMVGRLKNLPRTFVGAIVLGLLQSYALYGTQFLPQGFDAGGLVQGARAALPTLFLFAVMLLLPQEKLRIGRVGGTALPPLPSWRKTFAWSGVLLVVVYGVTGVLSNADVSRFGQALCISLIMLSLVVLTGYSGDVSLAQLSFAGVGAVVVGRTFGSLSPVSLLAAGVVAGTLGALVALPARRLRGLYLGLGTLAFAVAMDKMVFNTSVFGFGAGGGSLIIERPTLLGISLESERAFTMAVALSFVSMAWIVLAIRRGRFGRFLLAARDSDAACATLGFSTTRIRVLVFAISSAMAGVAGAVFTGMRVSVSTADFGFFGSLPLLLLAVVGGVTSVTGVLIGGLVLGLLPVISGLSPALGSLVFVGVLCAVVGLGGDPNGVANLLFRTGRRVLQRVTGAPEPAPPVVAVEDAAPETPAQRRVEEGATVGSA